MAESKGRDKRVDLKAKRGELRYRTDHPLSYRDKYGQRGKK
jgi:hypothetical protein